MKLRIAPGECYATAEPAAVLTTLLGSCVSACIYDLEARVGGMNHFLLPLTGKRHPPSTRYGDFAMEKLIEELLKLGAEVGRLQAKVFGGAVLGGGEAPLSWIGQRNGRFALDYLASRSIPVVAHDLGGESARRLEFKPALGHVRVRRLKSKFEEVQYQSQELDGLEEE